MVFSASDELNVIFIGLEVYVRKFGIFSIFLFLSPFKLKTFAKSDLRVQY